MQLQAESETALPFLLTNWQSSTVSLIPIIDNRECFIRNAFGTTDKTLSRTLKLYTRLEGWWSYIS